VTRAAPALVATNVHVVYRTRLDQATSLRERLTGGSGRKRSEVHAVRGVDMTLHQGESIGIVGSNGSGKSSLVGALAGLIPLEQGNVRAVARPAILGVGAALNGALSGKRNIRLGLLALGTSKEHIGDRIRHIIEFSGLAHAIDRPMATYSSGMRARLAFSIATEVAPDILIVDEALSVGDRNFRSRAADRLDEIRESAGAVVVISHNLNEIAAMCTRVAWLEDGQLVADGEPGDVIPEYESANPSPAREERQARRKARRERIRNQEREKAAQWAQEQIEANLSDVTEPQDDMTLPGRSDR